MKRLFYIVLCLLPLLACRQEESPSAVVKDNAPDGRVTVTFSVSMPVMQPSTKALSEETELKNLYLAVYGSTGGYKEYIKATPLKVDPTTELPIPSSQKIINFGGDIGEQTVAIYEFSASLQLSNTGRTIHFLGNGPDPSEFGTGKARSVLPDLLGGEGETGFWQMIDLDGIFALQDSETLQYLKRDEHGNLIPKEDIDPYVVSDETLKAFDKIELVRNWAKIVLDINTEGEGCHFTPKSFAVINTPLRGTLVPYGGSLGFIENYQTKSFEGLESIGYAGNLPNSVSLSGIDAASIPSDDDFKNGSNGAIKWTEETAETAAVYLYERPVPNDFMAPTYVLIYGTYLNTPENDPIFDPNMNSGLTTEEKEKGKDCYYKVDLMAKGQYFPVYRNFRYQIFIENIASLGHASPELAAASAGSADVSADVNASHLSDISDGTRRMNVQPWLSKTFIEGAKFNPEDLEDNDPTNDPDPQLFVIYYDDINKTSLHEGLNKNPESVWPELIPQNAGVILNPVLGLPREDGFRPIYFGVAEPGNIAKTQTLRIYCQTDLSGDSNETPLYRDIVVTVRPRQEMKVACRYPRVNRKIGKEQEIIISVPDGLSESMFPLEFMVEPQKMTLSPDTQKNNMPVVASNSLAGNNKASYHFLRTLSWDEYKTLSVKTIYDDEIEDDRRWRQFSCFFKTNCEKSGTTVFVYNQFFHGEKIVSGNEEEPSTDEPSYREYAYTSFTDYRTFDNPIFTTPIPCIKGETVTVSVGAEKDNKIWMDLKNLTPLFEYSSENGYVSYVPEQDDLILDFKTMSDDGDIAITFKSEDDSYETITLEPWHFSNAGIVDGRKGTGTYSTNTNYSDVAYGHVSPLADKYFLVSYLIDPEYPTDSKNTGPQITIKAPNGLKEGTATSFNDPKRVPNTAVNEYYREKWFQTTAGTGPVSLTLSAIGYVEETVEAFRYDGAIYNCAISNTTDWAKLVQDGFVQKNVIQNQVNGVFSLSFSTLSDAGELDANGIKLPKGGHYELEADIVSSDSDVFLYYAQIIYYVNDGTPMKPHDSDVEPNPDGSLYSAYLGNNSEYVWTIPWGETGGCLEMNAPANQDIIIKQIILRGFRGALKDSIGLGDDLTDGGGL